jgi:cysteinyl-tRNA synthetase
MDDDFNTPEALAVLQSLAREINTARDAGDAARAAARAGELRMLGGLLGLFGEPAEQWLRRTRPGAVAASRSATAPVSATPAETLSDSAIEAQIAARAAARKAKNWAESDRIRDVLEHAGVVLEDKPGGVTDWRRA